MTKLQHHKVFSYSFHSKCLSPNTKISTGPSPAPWADTPFHLIPTPRNCRCCDAVTHAANLCPHYETGAVFVASEMANVHNMILRGLNSIVQQATYIPDASKPEYNKEDVCDLLYYIHSWIKTLEHHHQIEETTFFPLVEKAMGVEDLMDELEEQHEEFQDGLIALKSYVEKVARKPSFYRWITIKTLIESFAPALVHNLFDEIDFLLSMDKFDGERLRHCWLEAEKVATKVEDQDTLYEIFPFVLGNCDRTYEGGNNFPIIPKALRYAIKHWYANKHRGAWRFNCCDFHGRPVPLRMLPENQLEE